MPAIAPELRPLEEPCDGLGVVVGVEVDEVDNEVDGVVRRVVGEEAGRDVEVRLYNSLSVRHCQKCMGSCIETGTL